MTSSLNDRAIRICFPCPKERPGVRGCGESEGERGRVICLDQVSDTRSALTFLSQHPQVQADKIALLGSSFGAAVSLYTGGIDKRVAAIVFVGRMG